MQYITLNNGVKMPQMGYGVYQVTPSEAERCVSDALSVGYRMIDTAQAYQNEDGVGNAVKKSGISRDEIFIVSKIWISNYGYERAKASIDESLRKLQTEYIDLMLLHQPFCDRYGAYRALEDAYHKGKLRAIGVSNFYPDHFIDLFLPRPFHRPCIECGGKTYGKSSRNSCFQPAASTAEIHGGVRMPDYVVGSIGRRS